MIERVRQGQGKPSKIYVRQFTSQGCPDLPHHSIGSRSQDCTEAEVLTAQNNTAASRKTGSQEYGKTECNYTNKNYAELIKSIHLSIHPETDLQRDSQLSGQLNPVTQQTATPCGVAVRASTAFVPQMPLVRGMPLETSPTAAGRYPVRGGYPTVRPPSRPGACCATAREPSLRGGRTSGGINGHQEITLASRAARTSSGRRIKSTRGA